MPTFVKIDIEGSEIEVLGASRDLLKRNAIHFAADTQHWVNGMRTTGEVERIFIECGYETLSSDAAGFWTTWARKKGTPPE